MIHIEQINLMDPQARAKIDALRAKLAIDGNIVSESGKQKTMEVFGEALSPKEVVERICTDVRLHGIHAALGYTQKLDQVHITADTLRVSKDELVAAHQSVDPKFLQTVRAIRENVLRFQKAILHHDVEVPLANGGWLRQRYVPLRRVGCCVPGGAAAYPSTVLMTAVPAQAAGVEEIVVCAPPTKYGSYNQELLATCHEIGIEEVYRIGGAQGVAAMAYGLEGLSRVDKIVGPGNLFVALAKKHVYGEVDIDSIAGPSEVVVIADASVPPDWVATDLIAQAEHSPGSSVLIAWEESVLVATQSALEVQLASLSRGDLARQALENYGAFILVENPEAAARLTDELAPEHLHIECNEAEALANTIRNAGATFVGAFTPVALGDYIAGPSHVLPTSGTSRWASGLSANHFLRSGSVIHFNENELQSVSEDAIRIAEMEGLTGHAESIRVRRKE